jgi:hypothetical protein
MSHASQLPPRIARHRASNQVRAAVAPARNLVPLMALVLVTASLLPIVATAAHAQRGGRDSVAYVTRLGQDTIAIERVISTHDSILGEVLDRYPRTERFTYAVRLTPAHEVAS